MEGNKAESAESFATIISSWRAQKHNEPEKTGLHGCLKHRVIFIHTYGGVPGCTKYTTSATGPKMGPEMPGEELCRSVGTEKLTRYW